MRLKEAPWFLGKWKEEKDAVEKKIAYIAFYIFYWYKACQPWQKYQ